VGEFNKGHAGEGRDNLLRDTWGAVREDRQRHGYKATAKKKMRCIVTRFGRLAAFKAASRLRGKLRICLSNRFN